VRKIELIKKLSSRLRLKQRKSAEIVDIMLNSIIESMGKGEEVHINGFGVFKFRSHKAQMARNPKNGDRVAVVAKRYPKFKPSDVLTSLVNNGGN